LRLKLDENVPGAVAGILRSHGHDADTVLDEALGGRDDPTVLDAAVSEGRLLLTLDRGFGDVRAYPPGTHPGIIVMRPDDQRVPTVVAMVEMLVSHHDLGDLVGCITVVQRNVLRVRRPDPR
jgi:predicted nuclease of predicted toxin-antitoxin system